MTSTEDRLAAALTARADQVDALTPARLPDARARLLTPGRVGALVAATAVASSALTATAVAGEDDEQPAERPVQAAPAPRVAPALDGERLQRDFDGDGEEDAVVLTGADVLRFELAAGGSPEEQLRPGSALLGVARWSGGGQGAVVRNGPEGGTVLRGVRGGKVVTPDTNGDLWLDLGDLHLRLIDYGDSVTLRSEQ